MEPHGHTHLVSLLDRQSDVVPGQKLGAAMLRELAAELNHIFEHLVSEHAQCAIYLLVQLFFFAQGGRQRF